MPGHVALMLHTFIGIDREAVRETVRKPFSDYLRSSIGLIVRASGDILPGVDPELDAIGVDEVACLIDFVGDTDIVLDGLEHLDRLKQTWHTSR